MINGLAACVIGFSHLPCTSGAKKETWVLLGLS